MPTSSLDVLDGSRLLHAQDPCQRDERNASHNVVERTDASLVHPEGRQRHQLDQDVVGATQSLVAAVAGQSHVQCPRACVVQDVWLLVGWLVAWIGAHAHRDEAVGEAGAKDAGKEADGRKHAALVRQVGQALPGCVATRLKHVAAGRAPLLQVHVAHRALQHVASGDGAHRCRRRSECEHDGEVQNGADHQCGKHKVELGKAPVGPGRHVAEDGEADADHLLNEHLDWELWIISHTLLPALQHRPQWPSSCSAAA
mmetsp:Transcript_17190/g.51637  ORF Transcript_17190/g.51637 Transcript_17190/m.51637 type:complete len:256 (-) Transcript_17190:340-1107(-)